MLPKKWTNPDLSGKMSPAQKATEPLNGAACKLGSIPQPVMVFQGCKPSLLGAANAPGFMPVSIHH